MPRATWLLTALVVLAGCHGKKPQASQADLPPLTASSWLVPIEAPGFGPALASLPLGARSPRPVLIALHGDHDRPEWTCGSYRHITRRASFILCPRGVARPDQDFTLDTASNSAEELRQALPSLKKHFASHVAAGPVVVAGLGPSVAHVIELALKEPSFFSHLLLVDGSTSRFTVSSAIRFGSAGGRRVLVVCSAGACDREVEEHLRALGPAGVATRVVHSKNGRGLDAEMVKILSTEFPWLISDAPRWR